MMTAVECLRQAHAAGRTYQRVVNQFVDDFRRADAEQRSSLIAEPIREVGELEGLVAAVVSTLCRETGTPPPA